MTEVTAEVNVTKAKRTASKAKAAAKMTAQDHAQRAGATEIVVPLSQLIEWEANPRKSRDQNDVIQMAASLSTVGQQQPLIIHKGSGQAYYKVIEGETRRAGFNLNASKGIVEPEVGVRCWLLPEDTTDAQMLAIALAANTVRRQMNPIEEMEAFRNLVQSGIKPKDIAEMFALETRTVLQRLALGSLVDSARDLVREGKRQMGWAQAMTLGSPAAQERIVNEILANPAAYQDGASVKAELTRGSIPVSAALFNPIELKECLVSDLFNLDGAFFSDVGAFWARQRVEIDKKIDELSQTHKDVRFFDRTRFDDAGWTSGGDPSESTAVIIAHDDGTVEIREGLIPPAGEADNDEGDFLNSASEHFQEELAATPENDGPVEAVAPAGPLMHPTKETHAYLTAQVAASLKLAVANDHRLAMAFLVAATLTRRGPVPPMIASSSPLDARDQTADVFSHLSAKRAARDRIVIEADIAHASSPAEVVGKLLTLDDSLLHQLFAYTISDAVTADLSENTMDIFHAVGADVLTGWRIEPAYLDTLTNAQVRALAQEVVDPQAQPSPRAARGAVVRAVLQAIEAAALSGDFTADTSWIPPQIQFAINKAEARRAASTDSIAQAA